MSARPQRLAHPEGGGLRVLRGRKIRKPAIAPWMIMALVGITAFLGLVFARTSLDNAAFELAELNAMISEQTELNRDLNIEIANLENPARIAPLAEEMGLIIPDETHQILVDLDRDAPQVVQASQDGQ
jgi:cell division protein FtsL